MVNGCVLELIFVMLTFCSFHILDAQALFLVVFVFQGVLWEMLLKISHA